MVKIDRAQLLARFLRYVQIGTPADPDSTSYPSSPSQLELGKLLADELREIGLSDVQHDSFGLVWATIPSNVSRPSPVVLLNAHLDVSPEAPGTDVCPRVIDSYAGSDIPLEHGERISVADCAELDQLVGKTLITTDGRTLLGGDDKAGVAVIMQFAATIMQHSELPHGEIRLLFTCDEEIGHGTNHVDLTRAAADVAYTLDGGGVGEIDQETFSADQAIVRFHGKNIHPAIAKDRMVNALRAASSFVAKMPLAELSPEHTCDRQGFMHPYDLRAGVGEATLQIILRDFDTAKLTEYAQLLRDIAFEIEAEFAGLQITVETRRQYRNMADFLKQSPLVVALAEQAYHKLGRQCKRTIVRGGTDGSQLSEKGLPTPNLSCGQHNIHSVHEFACLDQMIEAVEHLVALVELWSQQKK